MNNSYFFAFVLVITFCLPQWGFAIEPQNGWIPFAAMEKTDFPTIWMSKGETPLYFANSAASKIDSHIKKGTILQVLSQIDGWYHVKPIPSLPVKPQRLSSSKPSTDRTISFAEIANIFGDASLLSDGEKTEKWDAYKGAIASWRGQFLDSSELDGQIIVEISMSENIENTDVLLTLSMEQSHMVEELIIGDVINFSGELSDFSHKYELQFNIIQGIILNN
jgi:hypothetical protein